MNNVISYHLQISSWLNNSIDPIKGNFKKNDQYWGDVFAEYNITVAKGRTRTAKQLKDRFHRIKKNVAGFCGCYKKVSSIYTSGQSEDQLRDKALKMYEVDYKEGPFLFMYCWTVLRSQPKWHAYLEELDSSNKRKLDDGWKVDEHTSPENVEDLQRPIGTKAAKAERNGNGKGKGKAKIKERLSEMEDELEKFLEVISTTTKGRDDMADTQKLLSSEKLESQRLAHLAAKEHKESVLLETYRSLMTQDTKEMADDIRAEHMMALKFLREKLLKFD